MKHGIMAVHNITRCLSNVETYIWCIVFFTSVYFSPLHY